MNSKPVVMFSSGAASAIAAERVLKEGPAILLFTDTKFEDEDNYRFIEAEIDQRIHAHDWDIATFGKVLREIKTDLKKNFTYEIENKSRSPESIERAEDRGQAKHTRDYR